MEKCETCKFWGSPRDTQGWNSTPTFFFTPEDMSQEEEEARILELERQFKTCTGVPEIPDAEDLIKNDDKAYTIDGSGYMAHLRTRQDFGCVIHQPKETDE